MSADTTRKMKPTLGAGGVWSFTDESGLTHTSASKAGLLADLRDVQVARDRAAERENDRAAGIAQRKAAGAARLAVLAPKLQAAQQERDDLYKRFATAALEGGPVVDSFARYVLAFRRADSLRIEVIDARHESTHGQDRRGASVEGRTPVLGEAMQTVVDDRVKEIRAEVAA